MLQFVPNAITDLCWQFHENTFTLFLVTLLQKTEIREIKKSIVDPGDLTQHPQNVPGCFLSDI